MYHRGSASLVHLSNVVYRSIAVTYYNINKWLSSIAPLDKLILESGGAMKEKKQINLDIGQRIKSEREAAGFTQEHLAEMIGLGVKHISAIERGVVGISLTTLQKICTVLAISCDDLIFGKEVKKNDVQELTKRLERLSPEQYKIANEVFSSLLKAFSL